MKRILLFLTLTLLCFSNIIQAQSYTNVVTTTTVNSGLAYSPANGHTFSVYNRNAVPIEVTDISSVIVASPAGAVTFDLYYTQTGPHNTVLGLSGLPWSTAATGVTILGTMPWGVQPVFSGLKVTIPPGIICRFMIAWNFSGSNPAFQAIAGTPSATQVTVNNVDLLCGNNSISPSVWGSGSAPNNINSFAGSAYTYWAGSVTWKFSGKPCTDTPKCVVDAPSPVCPNRRFNIGVTPAYLDASYSWEYSDNGATWQPWAGVTPGLLGDIYDSLTAPRWYRCKIVCTNTGFSFQTPVRKVEIAPFYYCYCLNTIISKTDKTDIGNVSVNSLPEDRNIYSNGLSTPSLTNNTANKQYTTFQFSNAPVVMYRDSAYKVAVTEISSVATMTPNSNVAVFIDFNRNGIFDANEKVMKKTINAASLTQYQEFAVFTVPHSAEIGLTGMRVILSTGSTDSCGDINSEGEVEDYLVDMRYEPCKGPVNAGIAVTSDSALCKEYSYMVLDTTYEKKVSEVSRSWQVSGDNLFWSDINDSKELDNLGFTFTGQPLYYRMRAICVPTRDTTYSTPASIMPRDGNKCYCFSQAIGGNLFDSSDIGGISIGAYAFNLGGPHVSNPLAYKKRTDHTDDAPIQMYIDSIYKMTVYQIQHNEIHSDSKVTVFIDFNNNHKYDIPYERVYTNYTSISNFTLQDTFTVPPIVITGVPTGMRIILNNNIAPNDPSDLACGGYPSGETHDYMVMFNHKPFTTGIGQIEGMANFGLFPNPTTGKFHIQFTNSKPMKEVVVTVKSVTGQTMLQKSYDHKGGDFSADMDMSKQPRGVYFVELNSNGEKVMQKLVVE